MGQRQGGHAVELFTRRVTASRDQVALRHKEHGVWRSVTWGDWDRASRELAGGLRALGVVTGDRVGLLASSRVEWVFADVGIVRAGAATVPIYPSSTPEQCGYILGDSASKVVFVEDPHQLEKLLDQAIADELTDAGVARLVLVSETATLEKPDARGRLVVRLDDVLPPTHPRRPWVMTFGALREQGRRWLEEQGGALAAIEAELTPEHTFTIVYTSGTTGPPKGVVLTHGNIVFECAAVRDILELTGDDEQLLFLPLAHIFAKMLAWTSIDVGVRIAFAESIAKLTENMKEIRPTFMGSVPRVYEKAYAKILQGFAQKREKAVAGRLIDWALDVGKRASALRQRGEEPTGLLALQHRIADRLVFEKIRDVFGGNLRYFVSGGAPLAKEIAEFFHVAGILVLEGYGLTETTAATHVNRPRQFRFGTVGVPVPGIETRIADDGEILVRGGLVLREYFGKPEETRQALDPDGWFHTGDIGVIEPGGFLRITDRKKDLIVTAGGKNVAPQNLEGQLKAGCPLISQVMVHGDRRPYLVALITLNEEVAQAFARERGSQAAGGAAFARDPAVVAEVQAAVDGLNAKLPPYESIKRIAILPADFTPEADELTPTLKVKRKVVTQRHAELLGSLYARSDS